MNADTTVRARVDSATKEKAVTILKEQGLSISQAIRLMLTQVVQHKTLPFKHKSS